LGTGARQVGELLAIVPTPAKDKIDCPGVELDHHFEIMVALENRKASPKVFIRIESTD
jgi:hypothetical protein